MDKESTSEFDVNDIAKNIRRVVQSYESIAAASSSLGINRQQLNKYLNGTSKPSLRVLRRISHVTKIPVECLHDGHISGGSPADETATADHRIMPYRASERRSPSWAGKVNFDLSGLRGRYTRYYVSPIDPNCAVCEALRIIQVRQETYGISRRSTAEVTHSSGDVYSSFGISFYRNRMVMVENGDQEASAARSVLMLYVGPDNNPDFLTGHQLAVADFGTRPIFTSKAVLKKVTEPKESHVGMIRLSDLDTLTCDSLRSSCLQNQLEFDTSGDAG
ncbi:helix-turn-helix domain-containing protein [Szabonella alba]|uniref:Helix-turn-helix transcriptional regulator n=1 Tax=Szabonella alba TaxID=2804194 RepID=A0A8K0Y1J8_9RHOB|nr:helix-turn-helix transcriptional regulator [Szabonella alba]